MGKFLELSKIGFSVKCFRADFLHFSSATDTILLKFSHFVEDDSHIHFLLIYSVEIELAISIVVKRSYTKT